MVLLRNDGTLPIDVGAFKSVALIGPCADDPECNTGYTFAMVYRLNRITFFYTGDYNPQPAYIITPRAAFVNRSGLTVKLSLAF